MSDHPKDVDAYTTSYRDDRAWVFTIVCLVGLGLLLYAEVRRPRQARLPKMVASTAFIAVAISVGALDTTFGKIMLVGLALSWFGDHDVLTKKSRGFPSSCAHPVSSVAWFIYELGSILRAISQQNAISSLAIAVHTLF